MINHGIWRMKPYMYIVTNGAPHGMVWSTSPQMYFWVLLGREYGISAQCLHISAVQHALISFRWHPLFILNEQQPTYQSET